jgi:hypothetical protein
VAELGKQQGHTRKSQQGVELAGPGTKPTSRAGLFVYDRHGGAYRLGGVKGRLQIEVAIGLLDITIEEPNGPFSGKGHRQVDRESGLSRASLAAGDDDLHAVSICAKRRSMVSKTERKR